MPQNDTIRKGVVGTFCLISIAIVLRIIWLSGPDQAMNTALKDLAILAMGYLAGVLSKTQNDHPAPPEQGTADNPTVVTNAPDSAVAVVPVQDEDKNEG